EPPGKGIDLLSKFIHTESINVGSSESLPYYRRQRGLRVGSFKAFWFVRGRHLRQSNCNRIFRRNDYERCTRRSAKGAFEQVRVFETYRGRKVYSRHARESYHREDYVCEEVTILRRRAVREARRERRRFKSCSCCGGS